jgi:hypothetical protein
MDDYETHFYSLSPRDKYLAACFQLSILNNMAGRTPNDPIKYPFSSLSTETCCVGLNIIKYINLGVFENSFTQRSRMRGIRISVLNKVITRLCDIGCSWKLLTDEGKLQLLNMIRIGLTDYLHENDFSRIEKVFGFMAKMSISIPEDMIPTVVDAMRGLMNQILIADDRHLLLQSNHIKYLPSALYRILRVTKEHAAMPPVADVILQNYSNRAELTATLSDYFEAILEFRMQTR